MYNILVLIPMDEEKKKLLEEKSKGCKIVYSNENEVTKEALIHLKFLLLYINLLPLYLAASFLN